MPWNESSIKYECILASATLHAMYILPAQHYIAICGLSRSTIYFSHYLINSTIFGKKKLSNIRKMCVLIFSTGLSVTFLSLKRIQRDIITNVHMSLCKVPVILVRFQSNLIFFWGGGDFRKIFKYQISWKSRHTGRETEERTDGWTDKRTRRS
jgi:hypothetical protein